MSIDMENFSQEIREPVKKINLFINSPSYYTKEHGIIDDIYQMCSSISRKFDITLYTDALDTIGITPIIAPAHVINNGRYKETKMVSLPYRMADISLMSDYDCFFHADIKLKKQMIAENIYRSLSVIKRKLKGNFDYERMRNDIMEFLSISL